MTPAEVSEILEMHRPKEINGIPEDDFAAMMHHRNNLTKQGLNVL